MALHSNNKQFLMLTLVMLLMTLTTSCTVFQSLRYGGLPSQEDYEHFPQRKVANQGPVFNFIKPEKDYSLGTKVGLTNRDFNSTNVSLKSFTRMHKTISFMIIRNDTILYEYYNEPFTDTTLVSTFSMVKPIVSTLVGIALEEGKIGSIEDYLIDYLPELKDKIGWEKIKIRNLLHHTSGIKFTDGKFSLTSDNAKYYWGHSLRNEVLEAELEFPPDTQFKYSSINTQLLGMIIERVTNDTLTNYLAEKLWKPLGMEAPASWSLDGKNDKAIEKVFCCLQARTIDFAKFGRLYLNNGNWKGKQIVPKKWIEYSTKPDPSGNNKRYYNNNWGLGPLKYGSYFAIGLYGQFLYMYPEKKVLIVRFGNTNIAYRPNYWKETFLQIIDQI